MEAALHLGELLYSFQMCGVHVFMCNQIFVLKIKSCCSFDEGLVCSDADLFTLLTRLMAILVS